MINITAIVGSLRRESYNMQLAHTMKQRYEHKFTTTIADIESLPHFNQDLENDPPPTVINFKTTIANADGIIIITPEYNWSIPGVLKNALDWASRVDKVFVGKPVLPLGATPGLLGTVRAQMHLRVVLSSAGMQAKVFPPGGNEILVNNATEKFDAHTGRLTDEGTLSFMDSVVEKFVGFVQSGRRPGQRIIK